MINEITDEPSIRKDLLSYQPICDRHLAIYGVEMVSRNLKTSNQKSAIPPAAQSVSAILNAFIYAGMDELFRKRIVFVKVAESFLQSEVITLLPKERIVLELSPCDEVSQTLIDRFTELTTAGYLIALDAWVSNDKRQPLLAQAAFVKVNMSDREQARLAAQEIRKSSAKLLASEVNDEQALELARSLNADFFQGSFFRAPKQTTRKMQPVLIKTVLELIAELNSDGSDLRLEVFFKENPTLSLQLLQMVNSAATGFTIQISSIRQAISILGRSQMIRWLQILLYTLDDNNGRPSPLMHAALVRARLMELIAQKYHYKTAYSLENIAFVTGIISLADVLLGDPMEEIISKLNLSEKIQQAILKHEGPLGIMLELVEAIENGNFEVALENANTLHLSADFIMTCQNDANAWANKISSNQQIESNEAH